MEWKDNGCQVMLKGQTGKEQKSKDWWSFIRWLI